MNELTSEWIAKAEGDFEAAELLLRGGEHPLPDAACFHSQQCAEKYLKAFLQEHQVRFERTHDLIALLNLCLKIDLGFEILRKDLEKLENFAVGVRYPGLAATFLLAEQALLVTGRVRTWVRERLKA
jgi:HEPN domain-containing protein